MPVEIMAVGGYEEVGRNMTAIKVDDEVILCDMGLNLEPYIALSEDYQDLDVPISPQKLISSSACPDIHSLGDWKEKVKAIVPSHAHLDHVGAIPYLANSFKAPVYGTPYTCAVISALLKDKGFELKNLVFSVDVGKTVKITDTISVEFIRATHSVPHASMLAIHTPYGTILYANDFKFDDTPVLGEAPPYDRLAELSTEENGVYCVLCDSTYAPTSGKMPSEMTAREKLKEVFENVSEDKGLVVTTFSSHLARLQSIVDFGKKTGRKIVFLGRSLGKYVFAGEEVGLVPYIEDIEIIPFKNKVRRYLRTVLDQGKENYLLVVTGHQGESQAILSELARTSFFSEGDSVVFSCNVIPTQINIDARDKLELSLHEQGVEVYTNVHASGHGAIDDIMKLIHLTKPKHIIPSHGEPAMREALKAQCEKEGLSPIHLMMNGDTVILD